MRIIAIIPARMESSRLPGKPMKSILGISMIEHVRRRVTLCTLIDEVIVATCDQIIFDEIRNNGGQVIMTSKTHDSCVDRVAEAADKFNGDVIVNVQGDMPLVDPKSLKQLVNPMVKDKNINFTDMIAPISNELVINNGNIVKAVINNKGDVLYYSREAIPSNKKNKAYKQQHYMQLGINAFQNNSLECYTKLNRTPLEAIESIDMLRLLEHDYDVRAVITQTPALGVDTLDDLEQAISLMKKDTHFQKYRQ